MSATIYPSAVHWVAEPDSLQVFLIELILISFLFLKPLNPISFFKILPSKFNGSSFQTFQYDTFIFLLM